MWSGFSVWATGPDQSEPRSDPGNVRLFHMLEEEISWVLKRFFFFIL
ncbi:hypothetical protein Hhel01_03343 [Haloferula helveola]